MFVAPSEARDKKMPRSTPVGGADQHARGTRSLARALRLSRKTERQLPFLERTIEQRLHACFPILRSCAWIVAGPSVQSGAVTLESVVAGRAEGQRSPSEGGLFSGSPTMRTPTTGEFEP